MRHALNLVAREHRRQAFNCSMLLCNDHETCHDTTPATALLTAYTRFRQIPVETRSAHDLDA